MKTPRINRRQFFKLGAFGAGSLALPGVALASVTSAPSREAQAATEQPRKLAIPQPTFNAIASSTVFGAPFDLSAGWDGSLWAIDAFGGPHLYDPTQNVWLAHGDSVDATAIFVNTHAFYAFKGDQVFVHNTATNSVNVQSIAAQFPNVPDSFKLGVSGAAALYGVAGPLNDKLVLFKNGRFAPSDGSIPPQSLNSLPGWPTTPNWKDGLVDAVVAQEGITVYVFRGAEYVVINTLATPAQPNLFGPFPMSQLLTWGQCVPTDWLTSGIDAGYTANGEFFVLKGTSVVRFQNGSTTRTTPLYIAQVFSDWPATWHPVLNHAPSGRVGNLWCAASDGSILQHNGETWTVMPGGGVSACVGQDGTVMVGSVSGLYRWNGTGYDALGGPALNQVSLGDAEHVFVRDANNVVHHWDSANGFKQANLGAGVPNPTHMAANTDGTLWHCNEANPNAFRLVSEANLPSAQLQVKGGGIVTSVNKVASTGFGAAHCLATHSDNSVNVYRYDSPYVFKTSKTYESWWNPTSPMALGMGRVFMLQVTQDDSFGNLSIRFVALDMHTGAELAAYAPSGFKTNYTGFAVDPVHELLYVGTGIYDQDTNSKNNTAPGSVIALDARTLAVRWTFTTNASIDSTPVLSGTQLCFGDRSNTLYMIDTVAAATAASASKPVTAKWTWAMTTATSQTFRVSTPVISHGKVYATTWALGTQAINGNELGYYHYLAVCDAATGKNGATTHGEFIPEEDSKLLTFSLLGTAPALGTLQGTNNQPVDVVLVNDGFGVYAHPIDPTLPPAVQSFSIPAGQISTGFTFDDGARVGAGGLPSNGQDPAASRLWYGDNTGQLWSLNQRLQPSDHTPTNIGPQTGVFTKPVLYKDPQGGLTVLFGVLPQLGNLQPSLYGYDPDNGNHASLPTGVTNITVMVEGVTNGMVYAGGIGGYFGSDDSTPDQVFGIRVDELQQGLRDFVIESQMMQDPDPNATGGDPTSKTPPSFARYQTHISIVDDKKNPQIHEPVKIWCDTPGTEIAIDGQPFTVGPEDGAFASAKTGVDGTLVVTVDAKDYFAPVLRVWAGFMDTFERIVVNPDAEFHQRVMTAHDNANDDDPQKVNLHTAKNYNGASLFTDDEKNASPPVPSQIANSISQTNKSLGLNNNNSKAMYRKLMRAMGVKHKNQRISVTLVEAGAEPYLAYSDLAGATHFPTNTPATRLATIVQPIGMSFSRPGGDKTKQPEFKVMSHADASAAIDALHGVPWKPGDPYTSGLGNTHGGFQPMRATNIFQDFWNWLKGLFDKILQCILTIAEDIIAGIQYFVNDVLKVFKAILKVLEDVFPFLGSFFKMLEKLIDDVMAALSVLMAFGEIIKTHAIISQQVQAQAAAFKTAITTDIVPALNTAFGLGEDAIKGFFDQLRQSLAPNQPVSGVKGMGNTAHTTFSAAPGSYGPNGSNPSHAVQCGWMHQKLKSGLPTASQPSQSQAPQDDPLSDFITGFLARLTGDGDLSASFAQLQADIKKLFTPTSITQFFSTLLATLLDILETVLIGALAVTNAFIDGFLQMLSGVIDAVLSLLTQPIDIPFISWLYKAVFGSELTMLDLIALVAAFPVTILYRIIEGSYPSGDSLSANDANRVGAAPKIVQQILGGANAFVVVAMGMINAWDDMLGAEAPAIGGRISLGLGFVSTALTFPLITNDTPTKWDWVVFGFNSALLLDGIWSQFVSDEDKPLLVGNVAILSFGLLIFTIVAFVEDNTFNLSADVAFAAALLAPMPGMVNPVTLLAEPLPLIASAVDVGVAYADGFLDLLATFTSSEIRPNPQRLFLPWVAAK